jgi:hypothetical protein
LQDDPKQGGWDGYWKTQRNEETSGKKT